MNFYDNRFDFLRKTNSSAMIDFNNQNENILLEQYNEYKDYVLPIPKFKLPTLGEIGDGNIVTGSTCFFIDTGELFIFYESKNPLSGLPDGLQYWIKVGSYDEVTGKAQQFASGTNPYYDDEIPPIG